VAFTVNEYVVLAPVAVPEINPEDDKDKPVGRLPEARA
jgi:hypothetical protein